MRISCGGLRQGDAFRWAVTLRKEYGLDPLDLVVGSWSRPVWEFVVEHTDLNAKIAEVHTERTPYGEADYTSFLQNVGAVDDAPDVPRASTLEPYSGDIDFPEVDPDEEPYVLVAMTSISPGKCEIAIRDLGCRVKALRFDGEHSARIDGVVEWVTPKSWWETYNLVWGADAVLAAHVGALHIATFSAYPWILCKHHRSDLPGVSDFGLGMDVDPAKDVTSAAHGFLNGLGSQMTAWK